MFNWNTYWIFALAALLCWTTGALFAQFRKSASAAAHWLTLMGLIIYSVFIVGFWAEAGRPPLATQGETRLWFSLFLMGTGLILYHRHHYRAILLFSTLMSMVFMLLNILKPEIQTRELMPALQSIWFIPHVTIYMMSYALLGCTFILALIWTVKKDEDLFDKSDGMVKTGLILFVLAMFIGSIWAESAWGHFWTWDLKETWALITCCIYALYLHYRKMPKQCPGISCIILTSAFIALQICWWGVKYLPAASASMHIYH